jgi:hypothetical protein
VGPRPEVGPQPRGKRKTRRRTAGQCELPLPGLS